MGKYETHRVGLALSILALPLFTAGACHACGWWGLLLGPVIALLAVRPARGGGPCLWQRRRRK